MKSLTLTFFFVVTALVTTAQQNFVPGNITLPSGEIVAGQINDLYWKATPDFIEFKNEKGDVVKYNSESILEFRIGQKSIYKSRLIDYDSSSRKSSELTLDKNPRFKRKHVFLKVLVDADKSLLVWITKEDYFFYGSDGAVVELVSHPYETIIADHEIRLENKIYINQLRLIFSACSTITVPDKLLYNEKSLSDLFQKYATCTGQEARIYMKKEKVVVRKGIVGTLAYDEMLTGFKGGSGIGMGGFLSVYFPHRVYKYSLYSELVYRKFGDQLWLGVDYAGFPYKETHQIRSMKLTAIVRSHLNKIPGTPYSRYTYIGGGLTTSLGLADLYQRGPYVARSAGPFVGVVVNAGVYLTKNVALDLRLERGGSIYYSDFTSPDNRLPKSNGYFSVQGSLLIEF